MFRVAHFMLCVCLLPTMRLSTMASPTARETVETLAGRYGFSPPLNLAHGLALQSDYTAVMLHKHSRKLHYNRTVIWLNAAVTPRGKTWTLTLTDSQSILDALLRSEAAFRGMDITTIVLDPGHGGKDSGAVGYRNIYEKRVVLDVARRAKRHLEAAGLVVRMTRDRDHYLSLSERNAKAQRWGADLFVSIHMNAVADQRAVGIETFVCTSPGFASTHGSRVDTRRYHGNAYDKQNMVLGYLLQKNVIEATGGSDRGVKRARFQVLRDARYPAALVECGFISNRAEAEKVLKSDYREKIALGIVSGIRACVTRARAGAMRR